MDMNFVKTAYVLGYRVGMQKSAKPLSLEDYVHARRTLGLPEFDDETDYRRYLKGRKSMSIGLPSFLAAAYGAGGAGLGYLIGNDWKGSTIGALAGAGLGAAGGAGLAALSNLLAKKRLMRFAKAHKEYVKKDEERHVSDKQASVSKLAQKFDVSGEETKKKELIRRRKKVNRILSSLILGYMGASLGGAAGVLSAPRDKRVSRALLYGLAGGAAGAVGGYGAATVGNSLRDYLGFDPMLPSIRVESVNRTA